MGIAAFPDPVFLLTPRSFAQKTYNVTHYSEMPAGGHFAALEQPEICSLICERSLRRRRQSSLIEIPQAQMCRITLTVHGFNGRDRDRSIDAARLRQTSPRPGLTGRWRQRSGPCALSVAHRGGGATRGGPQTDRRAAMRARRLHLLRDRSANSATIGLSSPAFGQIRKTGHVPNAFQTAQAKAFASGAKQIIQLTEDERLVTLITPAAVRVIEQHTRLPRTRASGAGCRSSPE